MLHVTFKEASEVNGPLLATIPTKYLKSENVKKKKNRYKYIDYQEKVHITLEKLKPDVMIC